jgi:signal transduction histidine kinase
MKKLYLAIFWKFTIGIILIVGIFGSINILLINSSVIKALQSESEKRGKYIAYNISNQALDPIFYEDYITLQKLVDNIHIIDSTVVYAFIEVGQKDRKVIHNFNVDIPSDLLKANILTGNKEYQIKIITPKNDTKRVIRDIAVPILNKDIGVVRIGILENSIKESSDNTMFIFIMMVAVFLFIGIMGAIVFSRFITRPIKEISEIAENLDLDSLRVENNNLGAYHLRKEKSNFQILDEMDFFAEKFFSMIDRLKAAYSEINLTYSKLIQSEKLASIGTLSAGIAHEINNPNTGIQYCLRILKKEINSNDKNFEYIELMEEAADKIERVVKGLLEYARPQIIDFNEINLNGVIDKSIALLNYRFDKQKILIEVNNKEKDNIVFGSAHFLEQVIVNILINAVDAIEEKKNLNPDLKGSITLDIQNSGNMSVISIKDNGTGIKSENLSDVYDPFYSSKEVGKGTGLGLAVCNKIVSLHHGSINVKSEFGMGTTFTIFLPINREANN